MSKRWLYILLFSFIIFGGSFLIRRFLYLERKAMEKAKQEFLATLSHEIKNPLAALKEGLNLLSNQWEVLTPAARSKGFLACLIASKRLETILNNLLLISQEKDLYFKKDRDLQSFEELIELAVAEFLPLAEKKGMKINISSNDHRPFNFSWNGMIQVFENLILNAIKYGYEKSEIQIEVVRKSFPISGLEVCVKNKGDLIPFSEMKEIFKRFYRGSNRGNKQGLGIGLYVVKKIIEAHQGEIHATSMNGENCFYFWLPETS